MTSALFADPPGQASAAAGRPQERRPHPGRAGQPDEALDRLGRLNPRLARVVEYRFFAGYGEEQVAEIFAFCLPAVVET